MSMRLLKILSLGRNIKSKSSIEQVLCNSRYMIMPLNGTGQSCMFLDFILFDYGLCLILKMLKVFIHLIKNYIYWGQKALGNKG